MTRTFADSPAVRSHVPVLLGLYGASGGGKTFSALRLAAGIQRVQGGDVYVIDTEANRALHYADKFRFRHVPFGAPFSPADYLDAIQHCVGKRAGVVIVDSMSHEHEGPGGVLEMHDAELTRLSRGDDSARDRNNMRAWVRPKAERRRLINTILQLPASMIFCFRAKEKIKPAPRGAQDKNPIELGWMPISGEEFVYEMLVTFLLMPASGGVPTWQPESPGEQKMVKCPEQFRKLRERREPLDESVGERIARWASGEKTAAPTATTPVETEAREPGDEG